MQLFSKKIAMKNEIHAPITGLPMAQWVSYRLSVDPGMLELFMLLRSLIFVVDRPSLGLWHQATSNLHTLFAVCRRMWFLSNKRNALGKIDQMVALVKFP